MLALPPGRCTGCSGGGPGRGTCGCKTRRRLVDDPRGVRNPCTAVRRDGEPAQRAPWPGAGP
eukprot:11199850-Lingulodinium_polyedra.AAC.1